MNIDLSSYKIVLPPTRTITLSELRITPTKFIFSALAVADLDYAAHISVMYSETEHLLVVSPSQETQFTMPFYTPVEGEKLKALQICHVALVKALRKQMHWAPKGTYRIPGVRLPEGNFISFDLKRAECGKRERVKVDPEKFLESCPTIAQIEEKKNTQELRPIALLPSMGGMGDGVIDVSFSEQIVVG